MEEVTVWALADCGGLATAGPEPRGSTVDDATAGDWNDGGTEGARATAEAPFADEERPDEGRGIGTRAVAVCMTGDCGVIRGDEEELESRR